MRRLRTLLPCVAVVASAACAIPARDNHHDPSNVPTVRVRLVDYTEGGPGQTCPAFTGSGAEVSVASRGHCLAFDASATTDDSGVAVTGSAFSWSLVDDEGDLLEELPGSSGWLVLDTAFRNTRPVNEVLHMKVTARDRQGDRASALFDFVLTNSPPVAVAGPGRIVPYGGLAGSTATTLAIPLDGSASFDPDGDPLNLCWTELGVTPAPPPMCTGFTREHAPVHVDVDLFTATRRRFQLVADDNREVSAPRTESIYVRNLPAWFLSTGQIFQYDAGVTRVAIQSSAALAAFSDATDVRGPDPEADYAVAAFREFSPFGAFVSVTRLGPGATFADSASALFHASSPVQMLTAGHRDSPFFWVMTPEGDLLQQFEVAGSAEAPSIVPSTSRFSSAVPLPYDGLDQYIVAMDSLDRLWVASNRRSFADVASGAGEVYVFGNDASTTTFLDDDSLNVVSLTRRPGTSEMWALVLRNDGQTASRNVPGFYVWDTADDSLRILSAPSAGGLAFATTDQAWIADAAAGAARLVDIRIFEESGVEAATLRLAPVPGGIKDLETDSESGDCYGIGTELQTGFQTAVRVTIEGSVSVVPLASGGPPRGPIGRSGEVLHALGFGVALSRASSATEIVGAIAFPNRSAATVDRRTGGILAARTLPSSLSRFAENGVLTDYWTELQDDQGQAATVPFIGDLIAAPHGELLWAEAGYDPLDDDRVVTIDLTTEPPTIRTVIAAPADTDGFSLHPIVGSVARAYRHSTGVSLDMLDGVSGQATPVRDFTGRSSIPRSAAVAHDGRELCFVSKGPDPWLDLERIYPPEDALPPLVYGTMAAPTGIGVGSYGAFAAPGPDALCWFWTATPATQSPPTAWTLRARSYRPTGELVHSVTSVVGSNFEPKDLVASGETGFFMIASHPTFTIRTQVSHFAFGAEGGPTAINSLLPPTLLDMGNTFAR